MRRKVTFKLTHEAQLDLKNIGQYTEKEWGKVQRNSYLKQLDSAFKRLAKYPQMGTRVDEILLSARSMPEGYHNILYQEQYDFVLIIRVLHGRMNIEDFFNP